MLSAAAPRVPGSEADSASAVPVLLLKTRSEPGDAYDELLAAARFAPRFVPVLRHSPDDKGIGRLRYLLRQRQFGRGRDCAFGGLIFTSQRAVEAFAKVVDEGRGKGDAGWPHLQNVPIYSVGPATSRALNAVSQDPPLEVFGQHTGNGEALAHFILEHYGHNRPARLPLLFLVGEQRRDIISRTLMDPTLPAHQRIVVDEQIVYGTGVMESFAADFAASLRQTEAAPSRWVVVFSPAGCDSMLHGLGMLDTATGRVCPGRRDGKTFIAAIGPTTRAHLTRTFGLEPDVCADTPSPQGVLQAIAYFESTRT